MRENDLFPFPVLEFSFHGWMHPINYSVVHGEEEHQAQSRCQDNVVPSSWHGAGEHQYPLQGQGLICLPNLPIIHSA